MSTAIVPQTEPDAQAAAMVLMDRPPELVLQEAKRAAQALQDVIKAKPKPVIMNGEQYLEFEDWQTLARFYGFTACLEGDPEFVVLGDVRGFKATAVAMDKEGRIRSRATAYCLNDEEKWSSKPKYAWCYVLKDGSTSEEDPGTNNMVWEDNPNKPDKKRPKKVRQLVGEEKVPLYQLASMSQTRACAKVLRNVLSWVAVLAGYKPTPAEELTDDMDRGGGGKARPTQSNDERVVVDAEEVDIMEGAVHTPGKVRIPKQGPALTDPIALGEELLRVTGDRTAAQDLLKEIADGKQTVKGMAGSEVQAAWAKLAVHKMFGITATSSGSK